MPPENDTNLIPENYLGIHPTVCTYYISWGIWEQTLKNIDSHNNPIESLAYDLLKISASESTFFKFDLISERMLLQSLEKTSSAVFKLFKDEKVQFKYVFNFFRKITHDRWHFIA